MGERSMPNLTSSEMGPNLTSSEMGPAADRIMDHSYNGVQVIFLAGTAVPQVFHSRTDLRTSEDSPPDVLSLNTNKPSFKCRKRGKGTFLYGKFSKFCKQIAMVVSISSCCFDNRIRLRQVPIGNLVLVVVCCQCANFILVISGVSGTVQTNLLILAPILRCPEYIIIFFLLSCDKLKF